MSKSKKRLLIVITAVVAALAAIFCLWWFVLRDDGSSTPVSVEKVSIITRIGSGLQNRFAGVVEPQETKEVPLDSSRKLHETFVSVGDEVEEGDKLFSYTTEDLELQIEQMNLDIDRIKNSIKTLESTISALKKERDKLTSDSLKLEYTQQIQSNEAQVKQEEYNLKTKELDRDTQKTKVDDSVVYAEMSGIIQSIASQDPDSSMGGGYYYEPSQSTAYITILALGDFRIKGSINEQNMWDLEAGTEVTVRSRLDSEMTWVGYVDYIDKESPDSSSNSGFGYYMPPDPLVSSSRYPFYVVLEDTAGLMLGQHVYIEPYSAVEETGLWLSEYYILSDEDGTTWVWAVNQDRDRIEKRIVTLGGYNIDMHCFEILTGLTPDDEIAWPEDFIRPGLPVTREGFVSHVPDSPVDVDADRTPTVNDPLTDDEEGASGSDINEGDNDNIEGTAPPLSSNAVGNIDSINEDDLVRPLPTLPPNTSGSNVTVPTPPASNSNVRG